MAKHISDIFKDNPKLLKTKEVIELTEQFKIQFRNLQDDKHRYWDEVTQILLNTDYYVIDGLSSDEAIQLLIDKSF
jgi:hypothetical protein